MTFQRQWFRNRPSALGVVIFFFVLLPVWGQIASEHKTPASWMNRSLSPDERAALVVKVMTLDEKISLLHGTGMVGFSPMSQLALKTNGGGGYVVGVSPLRVSSLPVA